MTRMDILLRRFVSPKGESFILEQGEGMTQARSVLPLSLLEWRKELEAAGVGYFIVDLSSGSKKNIADLIALYFRRGVLPPVMTGNFRGGLM